MNITNIIPKHYKSVEQYAELCGVKAAAVYARISRAKSIKSETLIIGGYPVMFIDTKKYPTSKKEQRGRKKVPNE